MYYITISNMGDNYIFHVDWFTGNVPVWNTILDHYKNKPGLRFLEIGSFEGLSSVWLLENILTDNTSRLTCIDTFEGSIEHYNHETYKRLLPSLYDVFMHNISRFQHKTIVKRGKSQHIMKELYVQNEKYDFIYIDGDHVASSVIEDAVLAFSMLKVDGIMCFDDYDSSSNHADNLDLAQCAIDAFLKIYSRKIEVLHKGWQIVVKKISD